ncbi:amidohydrolase [Acidianus sp. RZ1]|uniref:amidohydrolase n=1 Tax=Acidianus sp. RZ1 TaxID=1540082 RepID=UPI0014922853|nr:amidohydrolase [Acidianus sp. RZ1]NON63611.1 amidohydrolase [Acidianus sp. RZ1]
MVFQNNTYTLTHCSYVLDLDGVRENVNIVIDNGYIIAVGDDTQGEEIDCSEFVVTPGFVNAHTHLGMIFLRGYYDDSNLHIWLSKMWEEERKALRETFRLSTEIGILEMMSYGITGFVDMYFNPEDVAEFSELYGIRAAAGITFLNSINDPNQVERVQRSLKKSKFFIPIINVHSIYSTDEKTIILAKELAEELKTWIHIHLSETRKEIYDTKRKLGLFPVEYINKLGLTPYLHAVHLGWVSSWELEILKASRSTAHCPTSNMKLATAGAFPFYEAKELGINVTIGTDGPASNNSLDIIREMKEAVLLQRHSYWDTRIKALDVFTAATLNGYKLLGVKGGKIKPGYVADLALFDKYSLRPLAKDRLLSNIVYLSTGDYIKKTILNGKIYDKKELTQKIRTIYDRLESLMEKA